MPDPLRFLVGELPPPPPKPPVTTVLAVALGDIQTPPAICAVRYETTLLAPGDEMFNEEPIFETRYVVLGAERLGGGLSYPAVAKRVNVLAKRLYNLDSRGDYHVLADASEIGRPVVDAIRSSINPACHVTSVRVVPGDVGDLSLLWRTDAKIGLAYLLSRLQAIVQGHRLTAPPALVDALRDTNPESPSPDVRALALCCASEFMAVRYEVSPDALPSAAF